MVSILPSRTFLYCYDQKISLNEREARNCTGRVHLQSCSLCLALKATSSIVFLRQRLSIRFHFFLIDMLSSKPVCPLCYEPECEVDPHRVTCPDCQVAQYCSPEHLRAHLPQHINSCRSISEVQSNFDWTDPDLALTCANYVEPFNVPSDSPWKMRNLLNPHGTSGRKYWPFLQALLECRTRSDLLTAHLVAMNILRFELFEVHRVWKALLFLKLRIGKDAQCFDYCMWLTCGNATTVRPPLFCCSILLQSQSTN